LHLLGRIEGTDPLLHIRSPGSRQDDDRLGGMVVMNLRYFEVQPALVSD